MQSDIVAGPGVSVESQAQDLRPLHRGAVVLQPLTAREQQVLRGVAYGYTNPQIADALQITIDGVKFHLKIIYGKLGAERRVHAVRIADRCGLMPADDTDIGLPEPKLICFRRKLSAGRLAR